MHSTRRFALVAATLAAAVAPVAAAYAGELAGSPRSMKRQHAIAVAERLDFATTATQLARLVASGELVPLESSADVVIDAQVPHRFARPEVRLLIERLAAQYRAATGNRLVVTSLVRPSSEQPRNAHPLSVHPVGMALDLRVPATARERAWLERTLLALEGDGVLDVTRERRPPHYHVAVYPAEYLAYVARRDSMGNVAAAPAIGMTPPAATAAGSSAAALVALTEGRERAVDVSEPREREGARVPAPFATLAFGGLAFVGIARERRRVVRRRFARAQRDRRA
jgi:Family of unknown function (DUF5715)